MTSTQPGPAVDQYRLLRPLGWGATGIVFAAEDMSLRRRVALKLMPGEADALPHACKLRHPHVVCIHDSGAYAGGAYLVMELVDGQSVQAFVDRGPVPWREATLMLIDACAGVAALHLGGIIHRDLKPANLLRSADGIVKVADFGLAARRGATLGVVGTPHYMSPEQCRAEPFDERSDIYALGATYYALLTGRPPYADGLPLRVMFDHCAAATPDPRKRRREIPRPCAEIVTRAMAKKRADRFASARAMRNALRRVMHGR